MDLRVVSVLRERRLSDLIFLVAVHLRFITSVIPCLKLNSLVVRSDFDLLAHGPRGTPAQHPLYVYRFHPSDGSLVLLNIVGDPELIPNPAFSRYHPRLNVVYTCTEDVYHNGVVVAYAVGPNGELEQLGDPVDAGGTSTCYLTIDRAGKHLLCVNYWDSTLASIPLDPDSGKLLGPIAHMYDPKQGQKMVAEGRCKGGVNHSCNDDSTIRMRQADPHSHALVMDPILGIVAFVPDLGKDIVREFYYNRTDGKIEFEFNKLPSGMSTGLPDGPRYLHFHPQYNIAYVVNELSSTIAVFEVDRALLQEMANAEKLGEDMRQFLGRSSLRLIQSIKTIPNAFPTEMNTCGRICVHKSGQFVVVSNRGHQSIAVFRVCRAQKKRGKLATVGYFHTRGETPRHFQFDASGQYLLVANQDTDSIAVFNFNLSSGDLKYTGNEYRVPSPNFVCCCPMQREDIDEEADGDIVTNISLVNHKAESVASSGEESDNSCTLVVEPLPSKQHERDLEDALTRARMEIDELKKELEKMRAVAKSTE